MGRIGSAAMVIGLAAVLTADLSQAESASRLEPLGEMPSVRPERGLLAPHEGRLHAPAASSESTPAPPSTPFGTASPPNQLTPAPVLPFNPNRPLMSPPSAPPPPIGGGRVGR